jgi:hypothetical protein
MEDNKQIEKREKTFPCKRHQILRSFKPTEQDETYLSKKKQTSVGQEKSYCLIHKETHHGIMKDGSRRYTLSLNKETSHEIRYSMAVLFSKSKKYRGEL